MAEQVGRVRLIGIGENKGRSKIESAVDERCWALWLIPFVSLEGASWECLDAAGHALEGL